MIIVGGRRLCDVSTHTNMDAEFIKDTHVLDMRTLEWSIITFRGVDLGGIYNFSSCLTEEGDLYVFGGTKEPLHQNQKLFRIREAVNMPNSIVSQPIKATKPWNLRVSVAAATQ